MSYQVPLVSIITPCFNSERFIAATIESVQAQTFVDWELIVSDDGSHDATIEIVNQFAKNDRRIRLITVSKNSGPGPTRNRALASSTGQYIAFLDSDDLWKRNKLEKQLKFMESVDAAFTFTSYEIIDEFGKEYNKIVHAPNCLNYKDLLKNTIIGCLTVIVDRSKVGDLTMPDIRNRQPLVVWLRILRQGIVARGLDEVLASYRIVKRSVSRNKVSAASNVWKVYRKYQSLSFIQSLYYFIHYALNGFVRNLR